MSETPTIDIPEVDDIDCAFPTRWRELLPKWEDLTDHEKRMSGPYCDAISSIFYKGGKLSDHLTPKPGTDMVKVSKYVRATLGDWGGKARAQDRRHCTHAGEVVRSEGCWLMSEYRPDEPSPLPQASTALSYRQGRIDGLKGKSRDLVGSNVDDWAAYRQGYEHGKSERRPKFPTRSVVLSVVVLVAVFIWWRIG